MNYNFMDKLTKLIEPIVISLGYELYFVEFINEDGENYLRIYIDNENGISLQDCEKVSRPISDLLDEADLIDDSYYLEVSSPGIYRNLYCDNHYKRYIDYEVIVKLNSLMNGNIEYMGQLLSFNNEAITIKTDSDVYHIPRKIIKCVTLNGEL